MLESKRSSTIKGRAKLPFEKLYLVPSRNGLTRPQSVRGSGYKMINMGELFKYNRINNPPMELVPLEETKIDDFSVHPGDLLFARQSIVAAGAGKCSIVLDVPETTVFESHIIRVRIDLNIGNPFFYYYYFRTPLANMQSIVSQCAQAGIRGSELAKLSVDCPPLTIQRKIAAILSAYDDLIENNLRRIKILEEMARMIYNEWFVKFRFPGHEKVKMVNSKIGKIPAGWKVIKIGDLTEQVREGVDPQNISPETPYFGLEHLPRRSITLDQWGKASDVQSIKLGFKKGAILFGKIRPYFHKVGVAPVDGVCSSDTIVLYPQRPDLFGLVLSCVSSDDFIALATKTSQGTKMPRANWDVLSEQFHPLPNKALLSEFNETILSIVNYLQNMLYKNKNLQATRDLLLPRLISGEIDVSDLDIDTRNLDKFPAHPEEVNA